MSGMADLTLSPDYLFPFPSLARANGERVNVRVPWNKMRDRWYCTRMGVHDRGLIHSVPIGKSCCCGAEQERKECP